MVSRKAGPNSQNDKVSSQVQQFLEEQEKAQRQQQQQQQQQTVASSGFVARSDETERAKEEARSWDRSQLLRVGDDDAQLKIFDEYSRGANTNAEGMNTRRGLGMGSDEPAAPVGKKKTMCFVSEGGAPSGTAASAAPLSAQPTSAAVHHQPPSM